MAELAIGIDVGGTGMKGGLVDLTEGRLAGERVRLKTPQPSTPENVAKTLSELMMRLDTNLPVGVGFPVVVVEGVAHTASNIDRSWIGTNVVEVLSSAVGRDVKVINDADAAGLAEVRFGAAQNVAGVVVLLTFGTGIGSALLVDGTLVPNTELGQLEVEGHRPAESYFAARARTEEGLEWDEWGERCNRYLKVVVRIINPRRIIIGGGLVRKWDRFSGRLDAGVEVVPAVLLNNAGIVGAALKTVTP